jgi:hypothetical protein
VETYRYIVYLHIAFGVVALTTFWTAAFLRKGSPRHRTVGKIYLLAMIGVLGSGVPLVLALAARGQPITSLFLTFLLLITGNACWFAWRAIRLKGQRERYFDATYWSMAGIVLIAGLGIVGLGVQVNSILLQVFGMIGVVGFVDGVVSQRRSASNPRWWLREHYGAMIGNGVATHIAFFSVGLRNAFPGLDPGVAQSLAWFTPLLGAVLAGVYLSRRYGRVAPRTSMLRQAA